MWWTDRQARRAARWMLLAAVLVGLFGMHVLTAEDGTCQHGALPMIGTSGHADMTGHDPSPADAMPVAMDAIGSVAGIGVVVTPADPGSGGDDHGAMACCCILFLAVGGAALILLLLRYRNGQGTTGLGRLAGTAVTDLRRRGPPGRWPRLALCVIRV